MYQLPQENEVQSEPTIQFYSKICSHHIYSKSRSSVSFHQFAKFSWRQLSINSWSHSGGFGVSIAFAPICGFALVSICLSIFFRLGFGSFYPFILIFHKSYLILYSWTDRDKSSSNILTFLWLSSKRDCTKLPIFPSFFQCRYEPVFCRQEEEGPCRLNAACLSFRISFVTQRNNSVESRMVGVQATHHIRGIYRDRFVSFHFQFADWWSWHPTSIAQTVHFPKRTVDLFSLMLPKISVQTWFSIFLWIIFLYLYRFASTQHIFLKEGLAKRSESSSQRMRSRILPVSILCICEPSSPFLSILPHTGVPQTPKNSMHGWQHFFASLHMGEAFQKSLHSRKFNVIFRSNLRTTRTPKGRNIKRWCT